MHLLIIAIIGLVKFGQKCSYFGIILIIFDVHKGQLLKVTGGLCNRSSNFCCWNKQQVFLLECEMMSNLQEEMDVFQRSVYPAVGKHFE